MIQTLFGSLDEEKNKKPGFLDRMKEAVSRTRENLSDRIEEIVAFNKEIDANTLDDLEATLIAADLGTTTTQVYVGVGPIGASGSHLVKPPQSVPNDYDQVGPRVGLAYSLGAQGKTVLLCAADTFRAAAIEQLEIWGSRTGVEVIKTKPGGDPSAVLFDSLSAAKARGTDYVIIDTAGRLHTKQNLMAELEKMRRTAQKVIPDAPHETLLVMDATTGQNGLQQARQFTQSAGVTGIVLTKLDGTAKGGVVVAISRELGVPVRYVGVGEKAGDLLPFDSQLFVDSLFE